MQTLPAVAAQTPYMRESVAALVLCCNIGWKVSQFDNNALLVLAGMARIIDTWQDCAVAI